MSIRFLSVLLLLTLTSTTIFAQQWVDYDSSFTAPFLTVSDLQSWTVTGNSPGNIITSCNGVSLIGGYYAFGNGAILQKSYAGLPSHLRISLSFTAYIIDSWDNEFFQVYVDGALVSSGQYQFQQVGVVQICGTTYGDRIITINLNLPHSSPTLTIKITSNLDQLSSDESWGIRDLDLSILTCGAPNCFTQSEEFTTTDFTDTQVVGWTTNQQHGTAGKPWTSQCGTFKLLGGYNSFGGGTILTKTYQNLPQHYKIYVSASIVLIDNYDPSWQIASIVDGIQIETYHKPGNDGDQGNICGQGQNEDLQEIGFYIAHSQPTLTLTFQDNLPAPLTARSWGIREVRISLIACTTDCNIVTQELTSPAFTPADVSGFSFTDNNQSATNVTSCNGVSILGGFGTYSTRNIKKTYTQLPEHTHLYVSAVLYFLDTWENENFWITVDDARVFLGTQRPTTQTVFTNSICGISNVRDDVQLVSVQVPHLNNQVTLSFLSELDQVATDESWGVRNIQIVAYKHPGLTRVAYDFADPVFKDAAGWTITDPAKQVANPVYTCGTLSIYGGQTFKQNTHIKKTFTQLPAHGQIRLTFKLYLIDSWDSSGLQDLEYVVIDGIPVSQYGKYPVWNSGPVDVCGPYPQPNGKDQILLVEITTFHTNSNVTIEIYDNLDQAVTDESWGIREFVLYTSTFTRPTGTCVILYSECQYQGKKLFVCDQDADFTKDSWYDRIKSVQVPTGWKVSLYPQTNFVGDAVEYTSSQPCLQ